jgi:hypothetical protein
MKIETKKIIAREFLICLTICTLCGLTFLFLHLYTSHIESKQLYLRVESKEIENKINVLKFKISVIENPPEENRKKMYSFLYEKALVTQSYKDFVDGASNEKELMLFHQELKVRNFLSRKNEKYRHFKQEFFGDIYLYKELDKIGLSNISLEDARKEIQELNHLLFEKRKVLKRLANKWVLRKTKQEYTIFIFMVIVGICYPLRFLVLATRWSIQILIQQNG